MWIAKLSWRNGLAKALGATPLLCPAWWMRLAASPPMGLVLADAEFDSEAHHRYIRTTLGAQSVMAPNPRRGIPEGAMRYQMYRAFPQKLYRPSLKWERSSRW
jgi:hypothetical protein